MATHSAQSLVLLGITMDTATYAAAAAAVACGAVIADFWRFNVGWAEKNIQKQIPNLERIIEIRRKIKNETLKNIIIYCATILWYVFVVMVHIWLARARFSCAMRIADSLIANIFAQTDMIFSSDLDDQNKKWIRINSIGLCNAAK